MSEESGLGAVEAPKVVNGEAKGNDLFQTILNPPDWLNQDYLEKALRDYEHDKTLLIAECEIVPATKPGDNFASVVFRANLKYTSKKHPAPGEKVSFIIKVKPFLDGLKKDMMGDVPFFDTEIKMYTTVLPEMQRLLAQTGDKDIIAPTLIHHGLNPDIVVFEDMSKYGYTARHDALNYENTHKLIIKLAKFHALSYYIQHESILDFKEFDLGVFSSGFADKMEFLPQSFGTFVEAAKDYEGYEHIVEKLEALKPTFMKRMSSIYKPSSGINVLNHGDFHIRNLLFRFDAEDPDRIDHISFIDFQICFWGSPAIDLYYMLYASSSNEGRERKDELIRAYHEKFCSVLSDLGFLKKPPSLLDLHIELLRFGFMEVGMATVFLPIMFMDFAAFSQEQANAEVKEDQGHGFEAMLEYTKKIFREEPLKGIVSKLLLKLLYTGQLELP